MAAQLPPPMPDRGWKTLPMAEIKGAIHRVIWGYPGPLVNEDELVNAICGKYGWEIGNRLVAALSSGVPLLSPQNASRSFLNVCVYFRRFDLIDRMLSIPDATLRAALSVDKCGWMMLLGTNEDTTTHVVYTRSLLKEAARAPESKARGAFELALDHFPGHPDIAEIVARGGPKAAILSEILMARHINASTATPGPAATAAAPRRHMVV